MNRPALDATTLSEAVVNGDTTAAAIAESFLECIQAREPEIQDDTETE